MPVLIGGASIRESGTEGIAFVLDLTERKQAEESLRENEQRYREVQMELAHANRVATMGQLTGSIAHEVNQPITATVIGAQAALRWLGRQPPALEEVRQSLAQIAKDGTRAGEVVGRIRDLIKKAPPRQDLLEINEPIRDVIELTRSEAVKNCVSMQADLAEGLPLIARRSSATPTSDAQLDHQRCRGNERRQRRRARIADQHAENRARVTWLVVVRDSGPGLAPDSSRAHLRGLLHDQNGRFGHGTVDLPFDHRSARRTIVGERERTSRCNVSVHSAFTGGDRSR